MVILDRIAAPIVLGKIQATIAAHLDATLEVGDIAYRPPFTVHLYDVRFIAHPHAPGGGRELLGARQIDLSLAQLPLRPGPLVIEKFSIDGLAVHLIRDPRGSYVGLDLVPASPPAASSTAMKLSDLLRLRHFELTDASIVYEDQSDPHSAPTQLRGINSRMNLAPASVAQYNFNFDAADAPLAQLKIAGTLDADSLILHIAQFATTVQSDLGQAQIGPDPLPAVARQWLSHYGIKGTITLDSSGTFPIQDPQHASFSADFGVTGGKATLPGSGPRLDDLAFSTHIESANGPSGIDAVKIGLRRFRAGSAGAVLKINAGTALIHPDGRWSINGMNGALDAPAASPGPWNLIGHADFHADVAHDPVTGQTPFVGGLNLVGINLQPPGVAAPVAALAGAVRFSGTGRADGQIDFNNFAAQYGGDRLALAHANLSFAQWPQRLVITDIRSHLDLVQNAPQCPGDLGPILQGCAPSGPFDITGAAALLQVMRSDGPGYSPEWDLDIATQNGSLALLDQRLPITSLSGHLLATKRAISVPAMHGTLLGGALDFNANARVVDPITYSGQLEVHGASVEQCAQIFNVRSPDGKLPSGDANLKLKFFATPDPATSSATTAATGPTTQLADDNSDELQQWISLLGADGSLQIDNGNLWALPALQSLSNHTRVAREALTAGEAAAIFSIANRTIYFKHAAVYSPALGLQGSGTETFAGMLDLDIIAAPLGDWKQKLAETNIPILSSVLSKAAGSIEKFVGSATSELLYHFHITGSRDDPEIQTVPVPILTDSVANLFGKMLHHDDSGAGKLVDEVNQK